MDNATLIAFNIEDEQQHHIKRNDTKKNILHSMQIYVHYMCVDIGTSQASQTTQQLSHFNFNVHNSKFELHDLIFCVPWNIYTIDIHFPDKKLKHGEKELCAQ